MQCRGRVDEVRQHGTPDGRRKNERKPVVAAGLPAPAQHFYELKNGYVYAATIIKVIQPIAYAHHRPNLSSRISPDCRDFVAAHIAAMGLWRLPLEMSLYFAHVLATAAAH